MSDILAMATFQYNFADVWRMFALKTKDCTVGNQ
jgi:hypothetical protein